MTYAEVRALGYTLADTTWEAGYLSRKTVISTQPVLYAGGKRKGQPYVEMPSFVSNRYFIRQYLNPPKSESYSKEVNKSCV